LWREGFHARGDDNATTSPETITPPIGSPLGGAKIDRKTYEFKANENTIISQLASRMHFVGLFLLATVWSSSGWASSMADTSCTNIGPIISGSLMCLVGLWTQRASTSFKSVVQTEGKDISYLMYALDNLRKLYSLQFWLSLSCWSVPDIFWLVSLGKIPWIF